MAKQVLDKIKEALRGTEFEGHAWLVGGAVRDRLLGRKHGNDIDIVVIGDAGKAAEILWKKDVATIPPVTYPKFGTSMVQVDGIAIEFATARKESYSEESRKPEVEQASINEDAARRDFTVNALFQDIFTDEVLDPLGKGHQDLKRRVLRTPLDPAQTFFDDPLRMLRAVRFRWQLGFDPAEGLFDAIKKERQRLNIVSAERIRDELLKMLSLADGHECLDDLMSLGLLDIFAPEFREGVGVEQGIYHDLDVWGHTVEVVGNTDHRDAELRLAALFHDVGKPRTIEKHPEGKITFYGHEVTGAEMASEMMDRLKFPHQQRDEVCLLVKNHMRFTGQKNLSETAARKILRDVGDHTERLLELCEADRLAHSNAAQKSDFSAFREVLSRVAERTPPEKLGSPLSGEQIMQLCNLQEGEEIGKIKRHLSDLVVDGTLDPEDTEVAEEAVRRYIGNR